MTFYISIILIQIFILCVWLVINLLKSRKINLMFYQLDKESNYFEKTFCFQILKVEMEIKLFLIIFFLLHVKNCNMYQLECKLTWYWKICMDTRCSILTDNKILCNSTKEDCKCNNKSLPISSECPEKYALECNTNSDCICEVGILILCFSLIFN